jgi:hypothetical protein
MPSRALDACESVGQALVLCAQCRDLLLLALRDTVSAWIDANDTPCASTMLMRLLSFP